MQTITTTFKILLHVAAIAFVLWLCTGGFLWKRSQSTLPAVRSFPVIVET